jgi:hypothetical protein
MRQYATPGQKPDGSMKRPMNAFILFSNEKRSELADLNPHLSNAAVSVLLGQRWREMLSAEKSGYVMAAKRIKEDFHAQHPDAKTRCVSRKAKRAKLDAAGRMGRSITPPSLQALALVGSRLNQTEPQGAVYGHPGEHRCESASTYTQRSAFDAPSRRSFDEEEYDDDDDEDMRWEANFDEPRASAPSSDEPQMRHTAMAVEYQPTLLEQLCTVAENEHTAAAHMLSAFGTAG